MMLNQTSDFESVDCMFQKFKPWAIRKVGTFPVPQGSFNYWIGRYCVEKDMLRTRENGFINGKLVFFQARIEYIGYNNMNRPQRELFKQRLDSMITKMNEESGPGINRCFLIAHDIFCWLNFRGIIIGDATKGA